MPAIQLARLKLQTGDLRESFTDPRQFVRGLRHILEFYANRTHRPGHSGTPSPLIQSYNVPPPVIRQILLEISPLVKEDTQAGLDLIDELWRQENLECRRMAVTLLGKLPLEDPSVALSRIRGWLANTEERLVPHLLDKGLEQMRREARGLFLKVIEGWLSSSDWREQRYGLRALLPSIEDSLFDDLPVIFKLLTPLVRKYPPVLRVDLVEVLQSLVRRTPKETAYFFRQNIIFEETPGLLRRVLKEFPDELQPALRDILKKTS